MGSSHYQNGAESLLDRIRRLEHEVSRLRGRTGGTLNAWEYDDVNDVTVQRFYTAPDRSTPILDLGTDGFHVYGSDGNRKLSLDDESFRVTAAGESDPTFVVDPDGIKGYDGTDEMLLINSDGYQRPGAAVTNMVRDTVFSLSAIGNKNESGSEWWTGRLTSRYVEGSFRWAVAGVSAFGSVDLKFGVGRVDNLGTATPTTFTLLASSTLTVTDQDPFLTIINLEFSGVDVSSTWYDGTTTGIGTYVEMITNPTGGGTPLDFTPLNTGSYVWMGSVDTTPVFDLTVSPGGL